VLKKKRRRGGKLSYPTRLRGKGRSSTIGLVGGGRPPPSSLLIGKGKRKGGKLLTHKRRKQGSAQRKRLVQEGDKGKVKKKIRGDWDNYYLMEKCFHDKAV